LVVLGSRGLCRHRRHRQRVGKGRSSGTDHGARAGDLGPARTDNRADCRANSGADANAYADTGTDADGGTWLSRDDIIALQAEAALQSGCQGVLLYSWEAFNSQQAAKELENAVALLGQY
jgi:hypothetical protein